MLKKIIFSLLCSTVISSAALADRADGIRFFDEKKYDQAFEEFSYLSDEGDNVASYYLGQMYEQGLGVEKSLPKAAEYFLKAYNSGNMTAASKLGNMLVKGEGIEKNIDDGLALLKTAGRAGDKDAQFVLGELYANGEDVEKNYVYAGGFYKMSALKGHPEAQYKLAILYLYGRGVPQDYALALKWISRSANQGYVKAQQDVADLLATDKRLYNAVEAYAWYSILAAYNTDDIGTWAAEQRDKIASKITDNKNVEIGQQIARKWQPVKGEKSVPEIELAEPLPIIPGYNDADTIRELKEQNEVVISDGSEWGIRTNELEEAIQKKDMSTIEAKINEWGKNGRPEAFTWLGKVQETRLQDPQTALKFYEQAAELGDAEGAFLTAKTYCEGKVVTTDPVKCYKWLQITVQQAKKEDLKDLASTTLKAVEPQLKAEEIEEAKKQVEDYNKPKMEEKGFKLF